MKFDVWENVKLLGTRQVRKQLKKMRTRGKSRKNWKMRRRRRKRRRRAI